MEYIQIKSIADAAEVNNADKAEVLMTRILDMQDEFAKRANRPDAKENKKRVKEYYSKLIADLQAEINSIGTEIAELSKKVNESLTK